MRMDGVKIPTLLFATPFLYILSTYTRIVSVIQQLAFYYCSAHHKTENDSS